MTTYIYMVRHSESDKSDGTEWQRGLTPRGKQDAHKVAERLRNEGITALYSSPYARAVDTISVLAAELGREIHTLEDLKERDWHGSDRQLTDEEVDLYLERMFAEPDFALPGGESNAACQARAVAALKNILHNHQGERIVIGTHGMVMALMMGYYADEYGPEFLDSLTKPDIYKMQFEGGTLAGVERLTV
ncbi:histidine phosphatase family protein [Paenibacillus sp. PK3_47]|uniref:histidine phosphatase family protein n=1 Tax=Paenibacillus sp. PK3_47 TaxID=2072642 RepID=UPI00201E38C7|nr:histidine phosphatase family protein [Paenibacillus sp. PK3_47]UQZ35159.1 histidine phosphatase family protein [Paenibacillus sp. PK3_47]